MLRRIPCFLCDAPAGFVFVSGGDFPVPVFCQLCAAQLVQFAECTGIPGWPDEKSWRNIACLDTRETYARRQKLHSNFWRWWQDNKDGKFHEISLDNANAILYNGATGQCESDQ